MKENTGKNNWIGLIAIILIVVITFVFVSRSKNNMNDIPLFPQQSIDLEKVPLFVDGVTSAGIEADQIGFHGFSPDGKYFFFTTFKNGRQPANEAYIFTLSTNTVSKLPGVPDRGIEDNRVFQIPAAGSITLYWPATGKSNTYKIDNNAFYGALSPDGTTYVVNTLNGVRLIDMKSEGVSTYTTKPGNSVYAWYSDNTHMLGFRETNEKLTDGAGNAREIGVWDIKGNSFAPIKTSITAKTFRSASWVVPDKIARINAGFDDGSHDYLLNVEDGTTIDLGDTSGSLMGGVKVDTAQGILALLGGDDQSTMGSKVVVYRGMDKVHEIDLSNGYFRESAQIIDADTIIYLRKHSTAKGIDGISLVKLNLNTKEETVLQELPAKAFASLSYSSTYRTWVLSTGALFMTGKL